MVRYHVEFESLPVPDSLSFADLTLTVEAYDKPDAISRAMSEARAMGFRHPHIAQCLTVYEALKRGIRSKE